SADGRRAGVAADRPVRCAHVTSMRLDDYLTNPRALLTGGLLLAALLLPLFANNFQLSFASRIVIWTIAAISLNIILGYGGMVSFGHAAYLGIGGYTMGIMAHHGITSGFLQFPAAMALSALWALAVGALSLRTRGVYFI